MTRGVRELGTLVVEVCQGVTSRETRTRNTVLRGWVPSTRGVRK